MGPKGFISEPTRALFSMNLLL